MKFLRCESLVEVPWKNGGGRTREIAMGMAGDRSVWRLSRADVTQDGAFSNFAGLVRILTVVSGRGMILQHPDGSMAAEPWTPLRFDGGLDVHARLKDGSLTDLNLMFDPAFCQADVMAKQGPLRQVVAPPARGIVAFHVLSGAPMVNAHGLATGDTAFAGTTDAALTLAQGDAVLEIGLRYLDHSNAIRLCIADG
ncbi:HutD family protein [Hoeflea sp. YIM 152468]|uniref:HutD/Ves family protein n=1 Tax=Hoeflea sp. YIM 152468 TaxID=3031759 RepID=UPI0023DC106A|nr:HutD family protein [Hoeflea sp. YIM 152468]MDF1610295.1 HutD family protein [Hoeflea sp. YIM 152468]